MNRADFVSVAIGAILLGASGAAAAGFPVFGAAPPPAPAAANGCGGVNGCSNTGTADASAAGATVDASAVPVAPVQPKANQCGGVAGCGTPKAAGPACEGEACAKSPTAVAAP